MTKWNIDNIPTTDGLVLIVDEKYEGVCKVLCHVDVKRGKGHLTQCDIRDANARLIASAPELLVALEKCKKWFDNSDDGLTKCKQCLLATINTAITKARG